MSKISNIGVLDVREIHEELAKDVTKIENIGLLIENDRSKILLKDTKMENIGGNIKIPDDKNIDFIMENGSLIIDREYLEGVVNPIIILVNGKVEFKKDIDLNLLNEKLYMAIINGKLICPKALVGFISSKGTINGKTIAYSSKYTYFDGNIDLTDRFLKSLKSDSKLSFNRLLVLKDIDLQLLESKISNMEVLSKLIIVDKLEEEISQYIDDYYGLNKIIIPSEGREVKYIDEDIIIDDNFIRKYDDIVLYVDGEVELKLEDITDFNRYIHLLICDKLICNDKIYEKVKNNLGEDTEVEIINGELIVNTGKMNLSGVIEEEIFIKNMGKLVLEDDLDYHSFEKNVISIINYGLIEAPEEKIDMITKKVDKNHGKIRGSKKKEQLKENGDREEKILYTNIGELKL